MNVFGKLIGAITSISSEQKSIQSHPSNDVHRVENGVLIWLDSNIDEINDNNCRHTLTELQRIFNHVNIFKNSEQCITFLNEIVDEKVFVIISGTLGQDVVPKIHHLCQISSIYIFCMDKSRHEQWINGWDKIIGVFVKTALLCEALQEDTRRCEHNAISITSIPNESNLDQSKISFMYTQILKEILLSNEYKASDIKEFIDYCRPMFINNKSQLIMIDELKRTYKKKDSIWWYTRHCFLYRMLNRALRLMDLDAIMKMDFFIQNLHDNIASLHSDQFKKCHQKQSFSVYRGQWLSRDEFVRIRDAQGGLLQFNNFLSTSKDRETSLTFAQTPNDNHNIFGVLFVMTIDPSIASTPFAFIRDYSHHQTENEILFSMHTVFRIGNINTIDENDCLWEIKLTQTTEAELELRTLTDCLRNEIQGCTPWDCLGRLFIKLGRMDKAEQVYKAMLQTKLDDQRKANLCNQLGWLKDSQGEYEESISFYEKSLKIIQKTSPQDKASLVSIYNNIGVVYTRMNDHSKALVFSHKALESGLKIYKPSHIQLAPIYNNLGLTYLKRNNWTNARLYLQIAFEIRKKHYPSNHPDLAESYNNLGLLYESTNDHSQAHEYYNEAYSIRQQILPANHPDLAKSLNSVKSGTAKIEIHPTLVSIHSCAIEI